MQWWFSFWHFFVYSTRVFSLSSPFFGFQVTILTSQQPRKQARERPRQTEEKRETERFGGLGFVMC